MCQQSQNSSKKRRSACLRTISHPITRLLPAALFLAIFLSGCSLRPDDKYVQPYTDEVSNWRQYLGVAVAIQILLMAWVFWNTGRKKKMSRFLLAMLLIPLIWTMVGEWIYRLGGRLLEMGTTGEVLAAVISAAGGMQGSLNVYSYLMGGVVFNDPHFLLFWAVPGVAASYLVAAAFMIKGKKKG